MTLITDSIVPAHTYNALPLIENSAKIPEIDREHLDDLRALLQKHRVPQEVCVRLIHKHFDVLEDEIMVLRTIPAPPYGIIQLMGPLKPQATSGLRGLNYFVNDHGDFEAYEYTTAKGPDLYNYGAFLKEFAEIVVERGLQWRW